MKVAAGHALWEVPVGFTRDEQDRVEKIADRQVQTAIESVFAKVRELGSARQTALWFRDNQTPLPEAVRGTRSREIVWRLPSESRIRQILKNPCYGRWAARDSIARSATWCSKRFSPRGSKPRSKR